MTRAAIERRLAVAEQRAARVVDLRTPPEVAAWLGSLTTDQLEAVEKALELTLGLAPPAGQGELEAIAVDSQELTRR
jgi:hypothetical protein